MHLQKDARLSLRELGRILEVPHTTVFTRVNKLISRGIIQKFQAVLHPHDLGFKVNMVIIEAPQNKDDNIAEQISELGQVMKVFRSDAGKIFVKALSDPTETDPMKAIESRLYGYDYVIHEIEQVVKYDHDLNDDLIKRMD